MAEGGRHLRAVAGGVLDHHGEIQEDYVAVPSDVAALTEALIQSKRREAALKAQITKLCAVDPDCETIMGVLEHWRIVCRHPKARIPSDGIRARTVKAMLALYKPERLCQALSFAGAMPYMGAFGKRYCEPGPGRVRRDELTLLLRDEKHVEELLALKPCTEHDEYRRWLHEQCQQYPRLVRALAFLAQHEPHGEVIANAARWAKEQGCQGTIGTQAKVPIRADSACVDANRKPPLPGSQTPRPGT